MDQDERLTLAVPHRSELDEPLAYLRRAILNLARNRRRGLARSRRTLARVPGALHDVTLSPAPVRERVFDEITRWSDAYLS